MLAFDQDLVELFVVSALDKTEMRYGLPRHYVTSPSNRTAHSTYPMVNTYVAAAAAAVAAAGCHVNTTHLVCDAHDIKSSGGIANIRTFSVQVTAAGHMAVTAHVSSPSGVDPDQATARVEVTAVTS